MDIKETIANMKSIPTENDLIKTLQMQVATVTFLKLPDSIFSNAFTLSSWFTPPSLDIDGP